MVSGRNGTNPEFPEQPSIASLFPAYESDTDASSEYNQIPPNFSHRDSPFPAYESDIDASSEYNQIPPNFSHHNSYSIVSIFPPARSQTDEIIIPNPTITSTSFSHVVPSSIEPTTIQISIPLLFPPTVSETEIDGSASSESNEAHPRVSNSIVSIFPPVRSPSNVSEIYETTLDHSVASTFPAEAVSNSYVFQQFMRSLSLQNYMKLKIVIKVEMGCQKSQTKALTVAAKANGVNFVGLGGAEKDEVVVIGDEVDATSLATAMRKQVGRAVIISVEEVNLGAVSNSYVFQQFMRSLSLQNYMKIVMRVQIDCQKCQTKALIVAAKAKGVNSVELGAEKDRVVVIGDEVDATSLTTAMRKKLRSAAVLSVEEVNLG